MGKTVKTRMHCSGEVHDGEAMLETSELLFRGTRRLLVSFDKIKNVEAKGGRLNVIFAGGEASFELGDAEAAKWVEKIRNPKTVVQKLGIKAGQKVAVIGVHDATFAGQLEEAGAEVTKSAGKGRDAIFYGVTSRDELPRLEKLRASLAPAGALWIIRPKGVKEVTESDVMHAGRSAGLTDVKVVRFSDTHTAEKFVIPAAKR
ncbi:MAG TPA: hypothetical protein VF618_00690 [Thermoanaerobaculia bacterium]